MVMAEKLILTFYNSNLLTSHKSNMLKSWPLKINTVYYYVTLTHFFVLWKSCAELWTASKRENANKLAFIRSPAGRTRLEYNTTNK